MDICTRCPRACGADRTVQTGFCGGADKLKIAKIMLHKDEEPVISGKNGSLAVFFSGCNLKCVFCQNFQISHALKGEFFSQDELTRKILDLSQGADNVDFITAGHYVNELLPVLRSLKQRSSLPLVYNSSGYEKPETLRKLDGLIDVFLPDLKYFDAQLSEKYSLAPDYFKVASKALDTMLNMQSKIVIEDGLIKKGVIVRHLVLPGCKDDSLKVIDYLAETCKDNILISLMRQYTPDFNRSDFQNLNRRVTSYEYNACLSRCREKGLNGFMQFQDSASKIYTPDF